MRTEPETTIPYRLGTHVIIVGDSARFYVGRTGVVIGAYEQRLTFGHDGVELMWCYVLELHRIASPRGHAPGFAASHAAIRPICPAAGQSIEWTGLLARRRYYPTEA